MVWIEEKGKPFEGWYRGIEKNTDSSTDDTPWQPWTNMSSSLKGEYKSLPVSGNVMDVVKIGEILSPTDCSDVQHCLRQDAVVFPRKHENQVHWFRRAVRALHVDGWIPTSTDIDGLLNELTERAIRKQTDLHELESRIVERCQYGLNP